MIENHPKDAAGKLMSFPGAPCAQPAEHFARQLAHLIDFSKLDMGYARWKAGQMAIDSPPWFAKLPTALDLALTNAGAQLREPYAEPASRLPRLAKGRRGLPIRRFFHETL